ncbi:hypothetical protein TNCV_4830091 [Trichonephila clavipes]|nr:hypothetical protein TNCV_4830091 [Trichonephila clavipes]
MIFFSLHHRNRRLCAGKRGPPSDLQVEGHPSRLPIIVSNILMVDERRGKGGLSTRENDSVITLSSTTNEYSSATDTGGLGSLPLWYVGILTIIGQSGVCEKRMEFRKYFMSFRFVTRWRGCTMGSGWWPCDG